MLFQRINRSSPEKIFVVAFNSYSTAAVTNGQYVEWDWNADGDGVSVTIPRARLTTAGIAGAGIVASGSVAAGDYGLIQVYGYHSAVRMRSFSIGIPPITKGSPLYGNILGALFCVENAVTHFTGLRIYPVALSLGANSSFTTLAKAAFIKAL